AANLLEGGKAVVRVNQELPLFKGVVLRRVSHAEVRVGQDRERAAGVARGRAGAGACARAGGRAGVSASRGSQGNNSQRGKTRQRLASTEISNFCCNLSHLMPPYRKL